MAEEIRGSKVLITAVVMCAALMAVLDISIVNVAISDIRASFGTPIDQIAWVSTGYMMANIVVIPMTGWLQRKFGYRRYFSTSILVFTAASALCGLAWNLPTLVLFRVLQGLGGGAIIPTSQAILFARYPREQHGMAGAMFGLGAVTGPLLGPTLGGYLIEKLSWHWIFLINVPVGLLVASLAFRVIEEPGFTPTRDPIDRWGIGLLAVGMATLQYVLEEGNRDGWLESPLIAVLGTLSVIVLVTFVVHELETEHPVVDLRVFANRSYAASTGINFLIGTALFSSTFLFSLYCGAVMHYSALDIGLLFLKGSCIQLLVMPLVGKFNNSIDQRLMIAWGVVVMCVSLWLNAHLTNLADERAMIMPIFVRSLGLGFLFVPLSVVALSGLPANQRGNAAGLFNLTRELGGSIGTAFMSFQLDRTSRAYYQYLAEKVNVFDANTLDQVQAMTGRFVGQVADPRAAALRAMGGRLSAQALIRAFNDGFMQLVFVFFIGIALTALIQRAKPGAPAPAGAH
jgi:DHA2 family multidrug resistance protein